MTSFAERLIERMAPWNTGPVVSGPGLPLLTSPTLETSPTLTTGGSEAAATTALELYCKAIARPYETILEACDEEGQQGEAGWVPAWGRIFNPETCPNRFLGYLGMYVGVSIPKVASEAEARELVKNEAGLARGTLKSLEEAVSRVLGSAPYTIQERTAENGTSAAYHFNVLVGVGKSSNALYESINQQKPAGLVYSVIEVKDAWIEGTKKWSAVAAGLKWSEAKEGNY